MRGDIYELEANQHARGHEQQGARYAVVVQSDALLSSTLISIPTSTSAHPATYRPEIRIGTKRTRLLVEQIQAVDPERQFGPRVGRLTPQEEDEVADALRLVLSLC